MLNCTKSGLSEGINVTKSNTSTSTAAISASAFSAGAPAIQGYNPTAGGWAGYFIGDIYCSGTYNPSDEKLKKDISLYSGALDRLTSLDVKSYVYDRSLLNGKMALPQQNQIGIMAQDLEKQFPALVKETTTYDNTNPALKEGERPSITFKAVNYTGLIPILVQAVKEMSAQYSAKQSELDAMNARLIELEKKIEALSSQKSLLKN